LLVVPAGFPAGTSRLVEGALAPIQGWHSDDYGDKRPAPTLVTTERLVLPTVRAHVLAPLARATHPAFTVESQRVDEGLVITIKNADVTDLVLCAPGRPWRFEEHGVEFAGELLHARITPDGTLRRFVAVDATTFRWNGEDRLATNGAPALRHRRASDPLVTIERT
jgi:hypothetical protein